MAGLPRRQGTRGSPRSPQTDQILRGAEVSPVGTTPVSPALNKYHDHEEDHGHNQKKSVLTKVKEKAKKWKRSLSKKKHSSDENTTPSWGVSLDEYEDEEVEDAEYLGAPMYESELAPEDIKETARQHPRANPVISEKHVLANTVKPSAQKEDEPNKTITETVSAKLAPAYSAMSGATQAIAAPAYATMSGATQAIASKVQKLTGSGSSTSSSPAASATKPSSTSSSTSPTATNVSSSASAASSVTKSSSVPASATAAAMEPLSTLLSPSAMKSSSTSSASSLAGKQASQEGKVFDKGVSPQAYLKQQLEPGEDEKALSQVISEAINPKRNPGDMSVVEKVKEAVTCLLRNEELSKTTIAHSTTNSSSKIPISSNVHEAAVEEEGQGRILQAN